MRAPFLLVAAVALSAVMLALQGCDASADPPQETVHLRVMTLNLDRGADFADYEDDGTPADLRVVGLYLAMTQSDPLARVARAAEAIAVEAPDVVALQEVMTVRSEYPSDWQPGSAPDAQDLRYDVLPVLLDTLRARGAAYRVASEAVTADWERTALVSGDAADIRFTERAVLLVREDRQSTDLRDIDLAPRPLRFAGETIETDRRAAVASIEGVTVATLRLDADDEHAGAKTLALVSELGEPVLLAGHVGSDGAGSAVETLTGNGFVDAWQYLVGDGGQTCCRTGNAPASERRADAIAGRSEELLFLDVALLSGRGISRYEGLLADLTVW